MIEKIGWLGGILMAFCALPEVYAAVTTYKVGLTWLFLIMWGVAEIFSLVYAIAKSRETNLFPLLFNYGVNIICISILIYYKLGYKL